MKILPKKSTLLVIDIQERLYPKIYQNEAVLDTAIWTVDVANKIGIPIVFTEHFPEKIGATLEVLRTRIEEKEVVTKTHFSAVAEGNLLKHFAEDRKQIVVLGTEAHVCVLQTVLDLLAFEFEVFVVDTGVGSRFEHDKMRALERMKQNGAEIITREMLVFEWLEKARTDLFRDVLETFIK
ncbi:isochorismatase family protein [Vaginella massiliensis]|uniref:isochorismatase family protein n=1 Tax=Vaginella massiliensis TaxID=1816680 RepID=UPI003753B340